MQRMVQSHHLPHSPRASTSVAPTPRPFSGSTVANRLGSRYTLLRNSIVLFISFAGDILLVVFRWVALDRWYLLFNLYQNQMRWLSFKSYGTHTWEIITEQQKWKKGITKRKKSALGAPFIHVHCTTKFSNCVWIFDNRQFFLLLAKGKLMFFFSVMNMENKLILLSARHFRLINHVCMAGAIQLE